jgi:hypothetical protein
VRSSLGRLLAHAEDEQPRTVRGRADALGFGNDGAPGDDRDPSEAGPRCAFDRLRADRRSI